MTVQLARSVFNFGETKDIAYGNQLKLYVFDKESNDSGVLIYSGYISDYLPDIEGSKEIINVTFFGYWTESNFYVLENSGATEVAYSSQSPLAIITDLISKFHAAGGRLQMGTSDDPKTSITYTYNCNTYQEAIMQAVLMSPYDYFSRVEPNGKLYLKQKNSSADHVFHIGRDIANFQQEKVTEHIINEVYFTGGGSPPSIYKKYTASGSVSAYGVHATRIVNEKVTDISAADAMANRQLNFFSNLEIRITLDIIDSNNNQDGQGYDIESIRPGDTCKILGATSKGNNLWDEIMWDVDAWDYDITNSAALVLQIIKVTYTPGIATLEISNWQPDLTQRIQQVDNNLLNLQTANNPSTPTT